MTDAFRERLGGPSFTTIAAKLTPAEIAFLLALQQPRPSNQVRLDQRDAAIRALAAEWSGWRRTHVADQIVKDLQRYAASGWLWEQSLDALPADTNPRRSLLHAVLRLNRGKTICWRQIMNILDGCRSG